MTLYELPVEFCKLLDMAEDELLSKEDVAKATEQLQRQLEEKLPGYGKVLAQLDAQIEMAKKEETRLKEKRQLMEKNRDNIKTAILTAMSVMQVKKVETSLFDFTVKPTAEKVVIDVKDAIPEEFLVTPPKKPDLTALKKHLQMGVFVDYAHLEKGSSLVIK